MPFFATIINLLCIQIISKNIAQRLCTYSITLRTIFGLPPPLPPSGQQTQHLSMANFCLVIMNCCFIKCNQAINLQLFFNKQLDRN